MIHYGAVQADPGLKAPPFQVLILKRITVLSTLTLLFAWPLQHDTPTHPLEYQPAGLVDNPHRVHARGKRLLGNGSRGVVARELTF